MTPVKKTSSPPKSPPGDNGHAPEGAWREEDGNKVRNTRALPLENKLKEVLLGTGAILSFKDEFVGIAVEKKAPEIAYGWAKLASEEPRVKRALEFVLEGSAWSEALLPTATLAVAVLWHYGIFIPDKIGVPMTIAVGVMPVSREVEQEMREAAAAESQQAAATTAQREADEAAAAATDKPINGDGPDEN